MKGLIFDLDGTLLYTLQDLADSVNCALEEQGLPPYPVDQYRTFVGDGARMLCRRALGSAGNDEAAVDRLLDAFRRHYARLRTATTRPYAGMSETLFALHQRGVSMAVLSNKPHEDTKAVIAAYFPNISFTAVQGQNAQVPPKPDPTGVHFLMKRMSLPPEEVAYLGDSGVDMRTARQANLLALGALWGYRDASELLEAGAQRLLDRPEALLSL